MSTWSKPAAVGERQHATSAEDADARLLDHIFATRKRLGRPVVIGLCGAQGSGKSTTAGRLGAKLDALPLANVVLSIDDFYLTHTERTTLASTIHPLLKTRGVPGTHDIPLAIRTLRKLLQAGPMEVVRIPTFDKSSDDRVPDVEWRLHRGPVEVVLLEGWCVGARPQSPDALMTPVNDLERNEDSDGRWRRYVNQQLEATYSDFFRLLDSRILLRAPDFETVHSWRAQQEAGLTRGDRSLTPMTDLELHRFIAHYERLTRWILLDEPAHLIVQLDSNRAPIEIRSREIAAQTKRGI